MNKVILCLLVLMICGASAKAQDKIYRKNGEVLKVKVLEVGSTEVKYRIFGAAEDSPIYVLERDRIKKIEYQDGRVEKTENDVDLKDPEQYMGQKRNAIKVNFLGPLVGFTQFTYERNTAVGQAFEVSLGIIGAGKSQQIEYWDPQTGNYKTDKKDQFGFAVAVGYKFNKLPDFLFGRTRYTHIMQGGYVRPVLYIGNYKENIVMDKGSSSMVLERQNVTFGALQIELGKQWVFGGKFVLDLYGGFGYGADNKKDEFGDNTSAYNYLNVRAGKSPGFSLNGGLKIGMLF